MNACEAVVHVVETNRVTLSTGSATAHGRILHVITGLDRGGAEGTLVQVLRLTQRAGGPQQRVVTLVDGGALLSDLLAAGVQVDSLEMERGKVSLGAVQRLRRLISEFRPDIVMTWLYHADLLGTLAACTCGVPCVMWNLRSSNMDLSFYGLSTRASVAILSRLSRLRGFVIGFNSWAGKAAHESFGYEAGRWLYLPNGVDLKRWYADSVDRAAVREELGMKPEDIVLAVVGRVDPKKDYPGVIAAIERILDSHPEARTVFIGRGTESLVLPHRARNRMLALGERGDVNRVMRGCDALISGSSFGEGFPNVIAEAMASGLPCVATDVGDARLLVGEAGLIVEPGDPDQLAHAVSELITGGAAYRAELGARARKQVETHWSIERAAERYRRVWSVAIRHARGAGQAS